MSRHISSPVKFALYHNSNSQCNICGIDLILMSNGQSINIGQLAHIIAHSTNPFAPRCVQGQEEDNSYDNLILLCPNHHAEIDRDIAEYTIDRLRSIKALHEEKIRLFYKQPLNDIINKELLFLRELFSLYYFQKYFTCLFFAPDKIPFTIMEIIDLETNLKESYQYYYPFKNQSLTQLFESLFKSVRHLKFYYSNDVIYLPVIDYSEACNHYFSLINQNYYQEVYQCVQSINGYLVNLCDFYRNQVRV